MTKINLSEKLGASFKHADKDTDAAVSNLPDTAWAALVAATEEKTGGTDVGIDAFVTVTHETLADFDNSRAKFWRERGSRTEHTFGGFKAVKFEDFQLEKGGERRTQIVIDCGEIRAVVY